MMTDVRCVVCEKLIKKPTCYSKTCDSSECRELYRRFLIWRLRDKRKSETKQKVYKVLKIKKCRKTKNGITRHKRNRGI